MSVVIRLIAHFYALLRRLYPAEFRAEFGEEMHVVFSEALADAVRRGPLPLVILCLREFRDLLITLPQAHRFTFSRKEEITMNEMSPVSPAQLSVSVNARASRLEALLGALPFIAFGLASMMSKTRWWPFEMGNPFLAFYLLALIGLGVGWASGFPRWSYAYLWWTLVFAWWWTDMHTYGLKIPGYTFRDEAWSWRIWLPVAVVAAMALLWIRSLLPLRQLVTGFWHDWTRVSLGGYILLASLILVADENHNPYLLALMATSTIAMAGGAWVYMRGAQAWRRALALLAGIGLTAVVGGISEATWDWRSYYGVPAPQGVPLYAETLRAVLALTFWAALLFSPALLGLVRRAIGSRRAV